MNRWLKHCGYYPSWNLRLLKRGHGHFEQMTDVGDTKSGDNEIHEHIVLDGGAGHLKYDMLHLAFPDISTFMEKHNRYSNWEAMVQFKQHKGAHGALTDTSISRRRKLKQLSRLLPFRPTLRFLYSYIWHRGFLDGYRGFIFSRLIANYEFLSVTKYRELQLREQDKTTEQELSTVPRLNWKAAGAGAGD